MKQVKCSRVPGMTTQQYKPEYKNKIKKNKKTARCLKNVIQEDQKGCKKNYNVRAEEDQTTVARTKHHEE